jgi:TolB-like protein/tetratricopeptide (TPR) repeat protein
LNRQSSAIPVTGPLSPGLHFAATRSLSTVAAKMSWRTVGRVDFARRALDVGADDPSILANSALALGYFGEDITATMALVDRALTLNPSYARGWHVSGILRLFAGQVDIAIEHVEAALRLSPRVRVGWAFNVIGAAHFFARRFDEAVPKLQLAIQEGQDNPTPHRLLAACYAHMGRRDDAREVAERLPAITSLVIPDASFLRNAEHRELLLAGLRLATGAGGTDEPALGKLSTEAKEAPLSGMPSIAVLPFENMSGAAQDYFVDGMVEEIITALSRIRWLFVLARNSSFSYKGQSPDVKQVGRELSVRYVLEGSVRKSGNRVRITAQLIDAETGAHLWADRFDGSMGEVFELQDQVASSVAGVIEPALQVAETVRSVGRPTADLTAYDLYLRSYAIFYSSGQTTEALRLAEQAIARDPRYGLALVWAAFCCYRISYDDRCEDRETMRLKGVDFARRALRVARDDPGILAIAAHALAYFGEDISAMMALVDRALALNPNYARAWHISGVLRMWAGQPDMAIEHEEAALRLSPRARVGQSLLVIGIAHLLRERFDLAAPKLLLAIQENPGDPTPFRFLAACYAHMGRLADARGIVDRLRAITPVVIPTTSNVQDPEQRALYLSGLRLAMGEVV